MGLAAEAFAVCRPPKVALQIGCINRRRNCTDFPFDDSGSSLRVFAEEVAARKPSGFDSYVILALRKSAKQSVPIGPPRLQEAARDVTSLGSIIVLLIITFAVAGFLFLTRKPGVAWLMLIAVLGGLAVNNLSEIRVCAPSARFCHPCGASFHDKLPERACHAVCDYISNDRRPARTSLPFTHVNLYFMSLAALLTALIGLSRIYLGVHFPTDILGGWCIGAAWAIGCWVLMAWLQHGGQVESPSPV